MPILAAAASRMRSTTFSPNRVGRVLMRKSICLVLDRFSLMRPSCGTRFSAMSNCAMTFRRAAMRGLSLLGTLATCFSRPSMRRRTR